MYYYKHIIIKSKAFLGINFDQFPPVIVIHTRWGVPPDHRRACSGKLPALAGRVVTEVSNKTASEYGYGKYVNAIIDNTVWAGECLPKDASDQDIKSATKRVRAKARYAYKKELS